MSQNLLQLKQAGFVSKVELLTQDNFILTIIVIICLGIASFIIELITEFIEHQFKKKQHILSVIQRLFHELMNLGIVSFSFIVFDLIGVYHGIATAVPKYNNREADVFGIFEVCHITIFVIAVFLIIIGVGVILFSLYYEKLWTSFEHKTLSKSEEIFLQQLQKRNDNKWYYLNPLYWIKYERALQQYQFHILREEFIITEGLPTKFHFAKYIVACFRNFASTHIHVSGKVWFFAICSEVLIISTIHIENPNIGAALVHVYG